jgi:hypothetical protein
MREDNKEKSLLAIMATFGVDWAILIQFYV